MPIGYINPVSILPMLWWQLT